MGDKLFREWENMESPEIETLNDNTNLEVNFNDDNTRLTDEVAREIIRKRDKIPR